MLRLAVLAPVSERLVVRPIKQLRLLFPLLPILSFLVLFPLRKSSTRRPTV